MTVEEMSAYLRIPVKTAYNWRSMNKGPKGIKVGRHVRYRYEDVEAWLNAQGAA